MHDEKCQHRELEEILLKSSSRLLIGNGINRFQRSYLSWEDLISNLAKEASVDIPDLLLQSEYLPELFDCLELEYRKFKSTSLSHKVAFQVFKDEIPKSESHYQVMRYALTHGLEILTTNFDSNFQSNSPTSLSLSRPGNKKLFGARQYWQSPLESGNHPGFRLHQIHGHASSVKSMILSLNQFASAITWIKNNVIDGKSNIYRALGSPCGYCRACLRCYWPGRGTWLEHFLLTEMTVLGLGYSKQEYLLRYLLLQRSKITQFSSISKSNFNIVMCLKDEKTQSFAQDVAYFKFLGANVLLLCDYKCIWDNHGWVVH